MDPRNRCRRGLTGVLALALLATPAAQAEPLHFAIPRGPVGEAVLELARQSNLSCLFSPHDVKGVITEGAYGDWEPLEALQVLLEGTGVHFEMASVDSFTLFRDRGDEPDTDQADTDEADAKDTEVEEG